MNGKIDCAANPALLTAALNCWNEWSDFRKERERCKRFTYGDQWLDMVEDGGVSISEADLIRRQGNMPLKNNLIRRLVRNVLGVFRNRYKMPRCVPRDEVEAPYARTMQFLLQCNSDLNRLEELYARTMEEFLISGLAVHKKWYGRRGRITDCWTDIVAADKFFVDRSARDFRGSDVELIGEIHDLRVAELLHSFAKDTDDYARLEKIYGINFESAKYDLYSTCRVVEVWHKECVPATLCHDRAAGNCFLADQSISLSNTDDIKSATILTDRWHYAYLGPHGEILAEGISGYEHGSHPYVVKAYPFVDGEIHSFVSDIIDQQKLTNRLISMYDWILRASAKGVLLFPEGALPDGVDIDDIAEEWSRFNGVIVYRPRPGVPLPQQVSSNSADIGITDLLQIQMKMMEDISGVNGALQGKLDSNSMSGTLYNQQTQNSLSALADLMKSFDDFMLEAVAMDAGNIRQYYGKGRIESIVGSKPGMVADFKPSSRFFLTPYDFNFTLE